MESSSKHQPMKYTLWNPLRVCSGLIALPALVPHKHGARKPPGKLSS